MYLECLYVEGASWKLGRSHHLISEVVPDALGRRRVLAGESKVVTSSEGSCGLAALLGEIAGGLAGGVPAPVLPQ